MLVDTSLLVRALQPRHPLCGVAKNAIDRLRLKGRRLYVVPRNLVDLWVVATRPAGENGLGMFFPEALAELARVKSFFALLPETEDARLVAAMHVHGLTSILTFDKTGFTRYAGIEVVYPATVAA